MEIQKALDIKRALLTLSDVLDISPKLIASYIGLFNNEKYDILIEASNIWNVFDSANLVERGKMLGIEIIEK